MLDSARVTRIQKFTDHSLPTNFTNWPGAAEFKPTTASVMAVMEHGAPARSAAA